uniref:Cytochrome c biogenesis protein n=1 Tax=Desulfovibrio sp. U5L TaxID=596152 RepID=I2Q6X7_9BACT
MLDQLFLAINTWMTGSLIVAAVGCFLWGLVSVLFSPCHLASIPLVVGYVAGQGRIIQGREAARYAVAFTSGLFLTIATIGILCTLLGRMLGDVGPYWTILVGAVLLWVSLDMMGVAKCSVSGGMMGKLKVKGVGGAFLLGLAYGVLSGSCTFGFIAPILAIITIQEKILTGVVLIVLFAIGHCLPIVAAGSSTALVQRWLENGAMRHGGTWFRKTAGGMIALLGIYFIAMPFWAA